MGGFVAAATERIHRAQVQVEAARQIDDAYEVALAVGELEDALRVADDHGLMVNAMGEG